MLMAPEVPRTLRGDGISLSRANSPRCHGISEASTEGTDAHEDAVAIPKPLPESQAPRHLETVDGMTIFRNEVDKQTLDRFEDVVERIQAPLIEYLRKNTKNFRPMAIRLMVLGKDESSAKPWLVVLCPAHTSKKVKKFFQKERIIRICQSKEPNDISFEVTTISQTLKPSAAQQLIDVFGVTNSFEENSNWSTRIRIQQHGDHHYATMGGIIVAIGSSNEKTYYGLTAGHILQHEDAVTETDTDDDSGYTSQEEEDGSSDGETVVPADFSVQTLAETAEASLAVTRYQGWRKVGRISNASFSRQAMDRDWALVEDATALLKQPGYLKVEKADSELIADGSYDSSEDASLEIVLMGEVTSEKSRVSGLPAMVLLPSGTKFVRVFTLSPAKGFILYPGSSGAWVIIASTQTVIGHIVADDPFGDVYIVPLIDIIADVKEVLNTESVSLPTEDDIANVHRDSSSNRANPSITAPAQRAGDASYGGGGGGGGGGGWGGGGGGGKPPVIHNGGGQSNDPNTNTSGPNSGYYA